MDYDFRWYKPELGRFISPDSIVPNPSNPQSLNRYSYVTNRPINFNDPTGRCPEELASCRESLASTSPQMKHLVPSNKYKKQTYVELICGSYVDNCGNPELSPYSKWATVSGYILEVVNCATSNKNDCATNFVNDFENNHPEADLILIGFSAGADIAILAANIIINSGKADQIKGLVVIDPTLFADRSIQDIADKVASIISTFLVDTAQDFHGTGKYYDDGTEIGEPYISNITGENLQALDVAVAEAYGVQFDAAGKFNYAHINGIAQDQSVANYVIGEFLNNLP